MLWPPVKAWTSKYHINGLRHFVAINYGGEFMERWIILTSVLDGSVSLKIFWPDLQDPSKWIEGWEDNDFLNAAKVAAPSGHKRVPSLIEISSLAATISSSLVLLFS